MPPPTRRRAQISSEAAESPLPARGSRRLAEKLASSSPRSSSSFAPPVSVSESSPLRRSPRKKRATEGTPRRPGAGGRTSLRGDLLSEDDASSSFSEDSSEEETSSDSADDLSSDSESDGTRAQKRRRGGAANATSASRRSKQTSSSSSSSSSSQKRGKQAQPASLQDEDDGWLECEREPEELVCEAPILGGEKTRKFFRKIVITERHKTDKVVDGRKTEIKVLQYVEVAVADRDREAGRDGRDEQAEFRNRTAQVMAIFQDSPVREKKKNGRGRGRQDAEKLMVELRWLYDREDIENHCWWMNVTVSDADLPQESWELADSDKCEILPADLIDEAVVAHYDRDSFSAFFEAEEEKEKKAEERKREKKEDPKSDRREKRERRGGEEKQEAVSAETEEEEAVESVILVTHFFCTKTSAILPLSTMDPDSFFQKLLRCSCFYLRFYDASHQGGSRSEAPRASLTSAGEQEQSGKEDTPHHQLVQRAVRRLQLDNIPDTLPCRTKECLQVRQFIRSSVLQSGNGEVLYVSGLPGTGKTATVQTVVRGLQDEVEQGILPPFDVVDVNAMRLPHPDFLFSVLHRRFFGTKAKSTQQAFAALDRYFTSSRVRGEKARGRGRDGEASSGEDREDGEEENYFTYCDSKGRRRGASSQGDWANRIVRRGRDRRPCLLIVDEVDCLLTQKQRVLYTLFDWPTQRTARLIVVGIANTIDLPDRFLSSRCASRVGFGRLTFNPYTREQIEEILLARLQECKYLFNEAAIKVCARKVANFFGDLRRALQVLRRALEMRQAEGVICPADIAKAANDLFDSPIKDAITALPWGLKLLLFSLLQAQRVDGGGVSLLQLRDRFQGILMSWQSGACKTDAEGKGAGEEAEGDGPLRASLASTQSVTYDELKTMVDVLVQLNVVRLGFYLPRVEAPSGSASDCLPEETALPSLQRSSRPGEGGRSQTTSPQKRRNASAAYASLGLSQGFGPLRVDPVVDELGGDMQVAIAVPLEDVSSAFMADPDFRSLL
ncbi:ATPase, AAA family protein [Toxoplasma gondii TgCatPRC2]|uniref:Origin recognition complex subunit 1 n=1 Tax=Toxoplasma gondii TgCatPRC2 TaxID=1130821 RepID=A0A151H193_TOXGO|nr:ATPase, AAA family protein [Toxoplasma gondii TgCatPRC2]